MKEDLEITERAPFCFRLLLMDIPLIMPSHERMFKATEIWKALKENAIEQRVARTVMRHSGSWPIRRGIPSGR